MTPNPRTITRGTTVRDAIREMETEHIRHLLVNDGPSLVGIVSRRELDLLSMVAAFDPDRTSVELAMTPEPFHVENATPVGTVARMMADAKVGAAVVTNDGQPVGIFTTIDALRALADLTASPR